MFSPPALVAGGALGCGASPTDHAIADGTLQVEPDLTPEERQIVDGWLDPANGEFEPGGGEATTYTEAIWAERDRKLEAARALRAERRAAAPQRAEVS